MSKKLCREKSDNFKALFFFFSQICRNISNNFEKKDYLNRSLLENIRLNI